MQTRITIWGLCFLAWGAAAETTLVDQLLAQYEQIESVTCDLRRDIMQDDQSMRWLSRIYFQRPDRLNVKNHAPLPRRIVSDGTTLFQHNRGQPRGFRQAVDELNEAMLLSLRRVPGTPMEHLVRLRGVPEIVLEGNEDHPIRRAYATANIYAVLHADEAGRLKRLELYDANDRSRLTGEIDFAAHVEVLPGVWIAMQQESRFLLSDLTVRETTRLSQYTVNTPIPADHFEPDHFFEDVEWVADFSKL